jgi:hypothetical protein
VVGGLKVKGNAHALSSTQERKVSKPEKTCGVDMILYSRAPTLKVMNEQKALQLIDVTQDRCVKDKKYRM